MSYSEVTAKNVVKMNGAIYGPMVLRGHTLIDKLERPRSVRINLSREEQVDPQDFYTAIIQQAKARPISIARSSYGNMVITFRDVSSRKRLLSLPCLELSNGQKYELHDPTNPIVHVQVLQVPFEFADDAISRKLARYGEIVSCRRGHHPGMPSVENGIRLYRMKLNGNIPSYIHFGSASLRVRYSNQPPTCRKCDELDHQANACNRRRCFNCDAFDHSHVSCTEDPRCAICEGFGHLAEECSEWQIWADHPGDDDLDSDSSDDEDPGDVIGQIVSAAVEDAVDGARNKPPEPEEPDQSKDESNLASQPSRESASTPQSTPEPGPTASSSTPVSNKPNPFATPSPLELMKAQKEHSASLKVKYDFPAKSSDLWADEMEEGECSDSSNGVKRAHSEGSSASTISHSSERNSSAKQKKKNRTNK